MSVNRTQLQAVLAEEGLEHDAALLATLEPLLALRPAEAPPMSPELARIFAAAAEAPLEVAPVVPLTRAAALKAEAAARPRTVKRHRGAMISILVAVGMGVGGTAVAAATVGGQGWDWGGSNRAAISHVEDQPPVSVDAPADVPGDESAVPEQSEGTQRENPEGAGQQGSAADRSQQGQNAQGQNAQGSDRSGNGGSGRSRQGSAGSQSGNSQGGSNQSGNSQSSGGPRSGGQGGNSQGENR